MTYRLKYALIGITFGLGFPVFAILIGAFNSPADYTLVDSISHQLLNPLIWIICTAPFFLGLFAYFAGLQYDNYIHEKELAIADVIELNKSLELRVAQRTIELEHSNEKLFVQQQELMKHQNHLQVLVKEQITDILKSKEQAELANMAKSDFLSNMSHELRTPMHAILSFSRFGINRLENSSHEKTKMYFEKIEQSGERLLILINNLLDLSKLESGKIELNYQNFDLVSIARQTMSEFELLVMEKSVAINLISEIKPVMIDCDMLKIEQVIRNLLSNALKFTAEDSIITIEILDLGETVQLSIIDKGVGIPEQELHDVFEKFIQSSVTKTGGGGTGLGLPISKEIIEIHGGIISVENIEQGGAKFWFSIPKKQGGNYSLSKAV